MIHMNTLRTIIPRLLAFIFLLTNLQGIAQNKSYSLQEKDSLPQVIVSVTKKEINRNALPVSTGYINAKDISFSPALNIDETLQYVSGLNVQRPFGIFGKSVVGIRGIVSSEPARQLILIDGIPINKTDGGTVNWNRINSLEIDHIEIIKGPGSLLYGSNAMGGVINLITKNPEDENFSGEAKAFYGTYNTFGTTVTGGQKLKFNPDYFYQISGKYLKSDGYITVPEKLRDSTDIAVFTRQQSIGLKTGYFKNKRNNFVISYQYFDDHNGQGRKIYLPEGQTADHDTHFIKADFFKSLSGILLELHPFYQKETYLKDIEKLKRDNYSLINVTSDRIDYGGILNLQIPYGSHIFNAGTNIRMGEVDAADIYQTATDRVINKGKQDNLSLYFQDIWKQEKWNILTGLSYHYSFFHNGLFEIENPTRNTSFMLDDTGKLSEKKWEGITYSVAAQYNFNNQNNLYVSLSNAFRTPSLDDLTRTGFINIGYKLANPELKPEKVWNYEAGSRFNLLHLSHRLAIYYSFGKDFMYYVFTGETLFGGRKNIFKKQNITEVEIKGFEWESNWHINKNNQLDFAYSYTDSKILSFENNPELKNKYLSYVPSHIFTFIWKTQWKRWQASTFYTYKSKQYRDDLNKQIIPEQQLIDFKMVYHTQAFGALEMGIQNLLNKTYQVSNDQISLGRFMTIGWTIGF